MMPDADFIGQELARCWGLSLTYGATMKPGTSSTTPGGKNDDWPHISNVTQ